MASTTNKRYPHPLQVHPKTGEPYLRLPAPNDNIIITPSRVTDVDATIAILNDVRVAMNLSGPPYPYLHEHAVSWIDMQIAEQRKVIEEMDRAAGDFEQTKYFENCPVQCIREVKEGDEEVFIGNVKISRSNFLPVRDKEEANRLQKENSARPVGDPDIEWFFGDYLAPSHHGKGIMSAAIKAVMDWAVPMMNVHHINVTANADNAASLRVFEKNGYTHLETIEDFGKQVESKGGRTYSLAVMEWRKEGKE
ncbi:acyl-CoA N-acyltransferase [Schizopora paradoxa]|uniref:Acyl-CoA N-acyltransferase n=1 Tax=Schizopora paradoxa TaxID=27342 RepID=A0A0H2RWV2_9AGAM|nr:acyl-CoA N-acyltransferase [Schizopora paradoxa]